MDLFKVNFHGSFSAAHGVGDFGGVNFNLISFFELPIIKLKSFKDVVNQFELNLNYIAELTEWLVQL